jgi:hypothetical protein
MSTDAPGNAPMSKNGTLIDDLLGEQQLLTPVAIFSRKHERHAVPARAKYYSDLIPLSSPVPGEQYATLCGRVLDSNDFAVVLPVRAPP